MVQENLLHKVRKSLSHPEIALFRARERDYYTQCAADYGYRFEIVPKKGIYQIDADTKSSLVALRNRAFECLLSNEFENRDIEFERISHVDWGVIPPHDDLANWRPDIFSVPGLRVLEPVGVRETRENEYCTHSSFYILPRFTSEFPSKESRGENHAQHKATVERKPITRVIDISLFPSFEYLQHLSEIHRERDAISALNLGLDSDSRRDYDKIKEMEREIGFVEVDVIHVPAYNAFFSGKTNGDPVKV